MNQILAFIGLVGGLLLLFVISVWIGEKIVDALYGRRTKIKILRYEGGTWLVCMPFEMRCRLGSIASELRGPFLKKKEARKVVRRLRRMSEEEV